MKFRLGMHIRPTKFLYPRHKLPKQGLRILDVGCGNHSPTQTKQWFPDCFYAGADIEIHNNTESDLAIMDAFYPVDVDGGGYAEIPESSFDYIILHHVVEHMTNSGEVLTALCSKLKPGGYIWIAFPSVRSLALPSAVGTLQFCDDETHVHMPEVREIANVLLANGVKVVHAGRSRSFVREMIGLAVMPVAFLRRALTGTLPVTGLWYVMGFEDHVFGQRRTQ